jgi:hypothetical protein
MITDYKPTEAVRMQSGRQESSLAVAPVVYDALAANPVNYFQDDNKTLSVWKQINAQHLYRPRRFSP